MIKLSVCIGSACHVRGAHNVVATFQHLMEEYSLHDKVELAASFCMRECTAAGVSVMIDKDKYRISPDEARTFFKEKILAAVK